MHEILTKQKREREGELSLLKSEMLYLKRFFSLFM